MSSIIFGAIKAGFRIQDDSLDFGTVPNFGLVNLRVHALSHGTDGTVHILSGYFLAHGSDGPVFSVLRT